MHRDRSDSRGQAFTLEGIAAAVILLSAFLLAVQSLLITPTTGGPIDAEAQTQLHQQAQDSLVIATQDKPGDASWLTLSEFVRYWSQSEMTFANATNPRVGYGYRTPPPPLGPTLEGTFVERNHQYNLYLRFRGETTSNGTRTLPVVYRGEPVGTSVVATETVVLYDTMTLTAPGAGSTELWEYDTNATANPVPNKSGYYPIPDADPDGPIYNVVEVRLVVW